MFPFFKKQPPSPSKPTIDPNNPIEPPLTTILKTLVIVYNPTIDTTSGKKLLEFMNWNRVEDLATGFMSDILLVSGGLVRYQIVGRYDVDDLPVKTDGYKYDAQAYLDVIRGVSRPHTPPEVDYYPIIKKFDILKQVANETIDEVWIFNFPHAGFHKSVMGGPGAFWCNAPPLKNTEASKRRFVIMGFSFERGTGEMLEHMGHRAESIMERTFARIPDDKSLWKRFIRYNKTHPDKAALGNLYFAPNSVREFDWNNPTTVESECDDWLFNFPDFKGVTRKVTAEDWGNGDARKHHIWWMKHFPKMMGRQNGIHNNWWQYIANPNNVST